MLLGLYPLTVTCAGNAAALPSSGLFSLPSSGAVDRMDGGFLSINKEQGLALRFLEGVLGSIGDPALKCSAVQGDGGYFSRQYSREAWSPVHLHTCVKVPVPTAQLCGCIVSPSSRILAFGRKKACHKAQPLCPLPDGCCGLTAASSRWVHG